MYTPAKTAQYERQIKKMAIEQGQGAAPLTGPLSVSIEFYLKKPKSSKRQFPTVKRNDLDNLCKALLDGLNGVAFEDDCCIVDLTAKKRYGHEGLIQVWIEEAQ